MRTVLPALLSLLLLACPARAADPPQGGEAPAARAAGAADAGETPRPDGVRLGMTEKALRARFGDALREAPVAAPGHPVTTYLAEKARAGAKPKAGEEKGAAEVAPAGDPYAGQRRLVRKLGGGDVVEAQYDLFDGKVYAIRWRLAERFERTLGEEYLAEARERYGKPTYHQHVVAKFGSGKTDVLRATWSRDDKLLEVRQLDPTSGGPVYVTLSDARVHKAIVAAQGMVAAAPDTLGPWWERPAKRYEPISKKERGEILAAFGKVLDQAAF